MISFIIALITLVAGYFIYGAFVEKQFGIDENRTTPAIEFDDGVDFVPMPAWRIFMVQFLNIAGLGPVFAGVIAWAPRRAENLLCGCADGRGQPSLPWREFFQTLEKFCSGFPNSRDVFYRKLIHKLGCSLQRVAA